MTCDGSAMLVEMKGRKVMGNIGSVSSVLFVCLMTAQGVDRDQSKDHIGVVG